MIGNMQRTVGSGASACRMRDGTNRTGLRGRRVALPIAALGIVLVAALMPVAAAAPGVVDDKDGQCNDGYRLQAVRFMPPLKKYDHNGNGVVCVRVTS